jgi:secreted trypsin-like serine protease
VKRAGTVKLLRHCPKRARPRVGLRQRELVDSLCWKPKPSGNDTCIGDSGGPLFVDGVVAGVHSAGITTSPVGCPSRLSWDTDVARFRKWIDGEIASRAGGW